METLRSRFYYSFSIFMMAAHAYYVHVHNVGSCLIDRRGSQARTAFTVRAFAQVRGRSTVARRRSVLPFFILALASSTASVAAIR